MGPVPFILLELVSGEQAIGNESLYYGLQNFQMGSTEVPLRSSLINTVWLMLLFPLFVSCAEMLTLFILVLPVEYLLYRNNSNALKIMLPV